MYHALLTNRYLTTRLIPFIAVGAVALCTALVIIVVSVMTGFVDMVRNAGRTLMGDVIITRPIHGFPHYDLIIEELMGMPEIAAATPVVESLGLLELPYNQSEGVQIYGVEPESFAQVTDYAEALYWRPVDDAKWLEMLDIVALDIWEVEAHEFDSIAPETRERVSGIASSQTLRTVLAIAPRENERAILDLDRENYREELPMLVNRQDTSWNEWHEFSGREPLLRERAEMELALHNGLTLSSLDGTEDSALAIGIHISAANERRSDGSIRVLAQGQWWMPLHMVTLTVLPISEGGQAANRPNSRVLPVANESRFGIYQVDDKRVMVPLAIAQEMLEMDASDVIQLDDDGNPVLDETGVPVVIGQRPARVNMLFVRGSPGVTPDDLKPLVEEAYGRVSDRLDEAGEPYGLPPHTGNMKVVTINTWEEQNADVIEPVEKERDLMRILFSIIYLVCAGLVLSIFWSIVYEKTRDIGVLRAIGASRRGVLAIFLRYGVAIGIGGAVVGIGIAYPVVHYINEIQDALASPPLILAVIAALPGVLALAWTAMSGGWRGLLFVAAVLVVLGITCGIPALVMHNRGVDVAGLLADWWEFLLGVPLIIMLLSFHIASGWFAKGALIPVLAGTLCFIASAAVAAMILRGHYFGGFVMWNPEVYYFTEIPNQVDWQRAAGTMFLAVIFSTLGAAIPAGRAADSDPVKALRYE